MSRSDHSQRQAEPTRRTTSRAFHQTTDPKWEQLVLELRAAREGLSPTAVKIDEMEIARYLAGQCSSEQRAEIERAMAISTELSECIALAREVLAKTEAAA